MLRIALRPFAAALLALAAASPAGAQRAAPPLSALRGDLPAAPAAYAPALQDGTRPVPGAALALGGIAGGALGVVAGAALGYGMETTLTHCQGDEFCGVGGILLGAAAGEVLLLPLGVHEANGRRGRYAEGVAVSLVVGLAGLGLVSTMGEAAPGMALAIPIAQLLAAVATERGTAARKQRAIDRADPPT